MPPLETQVPANVALCKDEDFEKEDSVIKAALLDISIESQIAEMGREMNTLGKEVVEPKTGIKFPSLLLCDKPNSVASYQVLAGVGIKGLNIVKIKTIKIYAFGFYIKPDGLVAQLGGRYTFLSSEDLKNNSGFYEDLLRHDLEMTVRLVVHYKGLKPGMVRSAFDTSLKNRLKKIKGVEEDEGLCIFNSYFEDNLLLSRGSVIDFRRITGGLLRTEINGRLIGDIYSNDFCRALFDIYIGDPPVSSKAKQEIGEKICQLLQQRS